MYPTTDLMTVLTLIGLSFLVACLELCFQFCMKPGMILNWYGRWLMTFVTEFEETNNPSWFDRFLAYITNPLGLCPYCNGIWLSIFTYYYFYGLTLPILLFIGITWFFIYTLNVYWYKYDKH